MPRSLCCTRYSLLLAVTVIAPAEGPLRARQPSTVAVSAGPTAAPRSLGLDDLLDVRTTTLSALSDDGCYAVALMTRPRTSMGIDYNRNFGDPTCAAPQRRDAWVMNTRSGERVTLFSEPRVIAGSAWSPDAHCR